MTKGLARDAPLSGASHVLLIEFESAAKELKNENFEAKLGKVDASEEKDLVKEFNIHQYPTLKFFMKGDRKNPLNCTGVRTYSSIITWLKRRIGASALRLTSITQIKTFIESEDVVVVGFFKDLKGNDTQTFYETAQDIPDLPFGITNNAKHFVKYGVTRDTVILFRKFEEKRVDYEITDENRLEKNILTKFIKVNELHLVTEYNQVSSMKTFDVDIDSHLLLFADKTSKEFNEMHESFKAAAVHFKGQIIFIFVDTNESRNGRIREFFQIRDLDIPAVRMINVTETVRYRMQADKVTTEAVETFCQAYLDGKEKPQQPSEELPEDWNKNPVKVLVGTNFEEVVFNNTKDVFVLFCAPWSQRCKDIYSIWDQLGKKYKNSETFVIAKIDITANEVDSVVIVEEYPSFKYFPADSKRKIVHYTGAHTLEALLQFLDKQEELKLQETGSSTEATGPQFRENGSSTLSNTPQLRENGSSTVSNTPQLRENRSSTESNTPQLWENGSSTVSNTPQLQENGSSTESNTPSFGRTGAAQSPTHPSSKKWRLQNNQRQISK
ncbi:protein disulfide-isomerase-like [Pristis pectinata]|uniref:protein disulfide-isomerase-like n=1 Tax=Pristis pectinata TaxID=685728 RepID=UPI00223D21CF|nr:protein disulfide-isomerase-like [Pristis pectinata]